MASTSIDHLIEMDRKSLFIKAAMSIVLLSAGIIIVFFGFSDGSLDNTQTLDTVEKALGIFSSLLSFQPLTDFVTRWQRLKTLQTIKGNPEFLGATEEKEVIKALYRKMLGV
jgi:hypothetical protein